MTMPSNHHCSRETCGSPCVENYCNICSQKSPDNYIEVPILFGFDQDRVIGSVRIEKEYVDMFPQMGLALGYTEKPIKEILNFGLVSRPNPEFLAHIKSVTKRKK